MKELDNNKLVARQEVAIMKIINMQEEQEIREKEVQIYAHTLKEGNITPQNYVSYMQTNRERCVENETK